MTKYFTLKSHKNVCGNKNLGNFVNNKQIPENESPKKVNSTVEKIIDFNKQQKNKKLKILTPKQMLQGILQLIAFAQVKAGKTSENILKEICQIMYSLYQVTEITKNLYNNTMNS